LTNFGVDPCNDFLDDFSSYRIGHDFNGGHERKNSVRSFGVFHLGEAKIFPQAFRDIRFCARVVNQHLKVPFSTPIHMGPTVSFCPA
jgi:hypothetical protein